MTKLTTEITIEELQYRIHAHENDLTQMWTADYFLNVQKELLALKQAAKNSADLKTLVISEIVDFYAGFESPGEPETVDETQSQLIKRIENVFGLAAPVLPKQPEHSRQHFESLCNQFWNWAEFDEINQDEEPLLEWNGSNYTHRVTAALWKMYQAAPAQPVIPEQTERERIRREHAEWSDATFGNVGPVGPLKHLSKEALEAAADPDDLLEFADMQFLLWDAQRRAGIPDDFITVAMIEKLEINKKRQWPEPKDGEPRLHINTQSAQPVSEPFKSPDGKDSAISEAVAAIYLNDSTDYLPALFSVVNALSPEIFSLLLSNEKAAFDATRLPAAPAQESE